MKNKILTAILALSLSVAGACSVKPGYIANGITKVPVGLTSTCGIYYAAYRAAAMKSSTQVKWTELYVADPTSNGNVGAVIAAALRAKGFALLSKDGTDTSYTFGFGNLKTGKVIALQVFMTGNLAFVGVGGN